MKRRVDEVKGGKHYTTGRRNVVNVRCRLGKDNAVQICQMGYCYIICNAARAVWVI